MTKQTTAEWAKDHSMDYGDYPLVIENEMPKDFSIPNHPEYFLGKPWNNDVKVEITSFRGISIGAIHYYAKLIVNQPNICCINENGSTSICGGYICEEWRSMPKSVSANIGGLWTIDALRELTQAEIDSDPSRWDYYRAGEFTNCFETKKEAIETAKKVAAFRFPGRKITIDDCTY